jgi:putative inorganic carbon (hco3(-)) transporter
VSASSPESRAALPAHMFPGPVWAAAGAMGAVVISAEASISPTAALMATVAIAAVVLVATRPAILPLILVVSIFMELVRVEGATISRVLAPIALLAVLVQLIRGKASIRPATPLFWAAAYGLWALASGLWTTSTAGTVFQLSSLSIAVVYMLAFASLIESRRDLERVVWVISIASFAFGMLSSQRVSEALGLGQVVVEAGRAQGALGDANAFAATELFALPLVIALAGHVKKRWLQLGLYATAFVIIGSIVKSVSRGGLVGLAVLLILLVVVPFRVLFRTRRNKAIALLVVTFGVAALSVRYSAPLSTRVQSTFDQADPGASSGSGRTYLWLAAWTSIEERPWLGLGYGGFRPASNELLLATPGVDLDVYPLKPRGQPAHNAYIGSLAELGILGLILYLGLLVSTAETLRRAARRGREVGAFFASSMAGALLLALVAWAAIATFISAETGRAFWIILGITLALPKVIASETASTESEAPTT